MIRDLTTGSVPQRLVRFAIPFVLANALQFLYNIVDMIIVGQYVGSAGLSAVSIGGEFMSLFTFFAIGFASAGQIVIAQSIGAGERERVSRVIGNMFTLILTMSLAVTAVALLFTDSFARLLNTPEEAFRETLDYCRVCGSGMFFVFGYNIVSFVMRGMGDSRRPLLFVAIAAGINLVLDLVFVAGFGMRSRGAALATVIGQAFSFLISLVYLYRRRESFGFTFRLNCFAPDRRALLTIIRLGIPMTLQGMAIVISMMYVTSRINIYGVVYSAVTGVSSKIAQLCNIVTFSLTSAGSAMIGQNFGAGKTERVSAVFWYALLLSLGFALLLSVFLLVFPNETFGLFDSDPAVLAVAMEVVPVTILHFFGAATRAPAMALINGVGFAGMNFVMGLMDGLVMRIGLALLLGGVMGYGIYGYWYGSAIAGYMFFAVIFPYFLSGAWKRRGTVI